MGYCTFQSSVTGETFTSLDIQKEAAEPSDLHSSLPTRKPLAYLPSRGYMSSEELREALSKIKLDGVPVSALLDKEWDVLSVLSMFNNELKKKLETMDKSNSAYKAYEDAIKLHENILKNVDINEAKVVFKEQIIQLGVNSGQASKSPFNVVGHTYRGQNYIFMSASGTFSVPTLFLSNERDIRKDDAQDWEELGSLSSFLHEVIHHIVENKLRVDEQFKDVMEDLYKTALRNSEKFNTLKKKDAFSAEYGLSSLSEFMAESLSNPVFREVLDSIEYVPKRSLWDVILDFLSNIFYSNPENLNSVLDYLNDLNLSAVYTPKSKLVEQGSFIRAAVTPDTLEQSYEQNVDGHVRIRKENKDGSVKDGILTFYTVDSLYDYLDTRLNKDNPRKALKDFQNKENIGIMKPGGFMYSHAESFRVVNNDYGEQELLMAKSEEEFEEKEETTDEQDTTEEPPVDENTFDLKELKDLNLGDARWRKNEDQYDLKDQEDKVLKTVPSVTSRKKDGGIGRFAPSLNERKAALEIAQQYWGNRNPKEKYYTNMSSEPIDMEEYAEQVEKRWGLGLAKGTIIHKIVQLSVETDPQKRDQLESDLRELYEISGFKPTYFSWVRKNIATITGPTMMGLNVQTTYDEAGNPVEHNIPNDERIYSEVQVVSELLGLGGTIDSLIRFSDGTWSLKDIKTSSSLRHFVNATLMKYGNQGVGAEFITQSSLHQAKLQTILYAFMLKVNNPTMKFRDLAVLWLPNEQILFSGKQGKQSIHPAPYLNMIRQLLENDYPDVVKRLQNNLGNKVYERLFDEAEYDNGLSRKARKQVEDSKSDIQTLLKLKMEQLQHYIAYDLNPHAFRHDKNKNTMEDKAAELVDEILELQSKIQNSTALNRKWESDISWLSLWLNSPSMVNSPYIQLYNKMLKQAKFNFNKEYSTKYTKFKMMALPLLNSYLKRTGKKPVRELSRNWINLVDIEKFWGPMIVSVTGTDGKPSDYKYRTTDAEWAEAKRDERFRNVTEKEWEMYRNLANYVMDTFDEFFIDTSSEPAYINQVASYQSFDFDGNPIRPMTHLQLHAQKNEAFKYFRGFMPKVPKDLNEMGTWLTSPEYRKEAWHRIATLKIETQFDMFNQDNVALPIKYLGNTKMNGDLNAFSINVEKQFDMFTRNMLYKKNMDPVYALAQGLRMRLAIEDDEFYKHTIEYFDKSADLHIRGKNQVNKGMFNFKQKNPTNIDIPKLVSSIFGFAISPIMWFNFQGGTANGIFGMLYLHKESVKNTVMKGSKVINADKDVVDFSFKDLMGAWKEVKDMYVESMTGTIHQNKTFILLNKFGYLPDSWDVATRRETMLTAKNPIFDQSFAYLFYSMPEEAIATLTMVAQLKSMKMKEGKYKGRTLWDMYEKVTKKDGNGNDYIDYEWLTDPDTGKPYVRYYKKIVRDSGDPEQNIPEQVEYEEITDLTGDEVSRLYFVYERMQGGYRKEEKPLYEWFFIGSIMATLRRYLPNILRNGAMSAGERMTYGSFKQVEQEIKNGKPVVQWVSEVMEGRWMVLAKYFFSKPLRKGMQKLINPEKDPSERNAMENFVFKYVRTATPHTQSYDWDSLSTQQKEAVVDGVLTLFFTFGMGSIHYAIFGGDISDDDPWNRFFSRIQRDFSQQYNFWELGKNIATVNPVGAKKLYDFVVDGAAVMQSLLFYAMGDMESAFTNEDVLRGWNMWQRDIPIISAIRRWVSDIERVDPDWDVRGWFSPKHTDVMTRMYSS